MEKNTQEDWFRARKNGYLRMVKATRRSAIRYASDKLHALWKKDLRRALHHRQLQKLCKQWGL